MRTSRRRFVAVAVAVLGISLSWSSLAAPAAAGGPTSVLLVSPDTGRTASLYTGDPDYDLLAGLLGDSADAGVPAEPSAADAEAHASGAGVTVTWLIHDVQVWRVDRIYPEAAGGPWAATQVSTGGSAFIGDIPTTWHVVTRGKELEALLDRLGLGAATPPPPPPPSTVPAAAVAAPAGVTATAMSQAPQPVGGAGSGGLALLLTGLVGALAGAGVVLAASRRRHPRPGAPAAAAADDAHAMEFELLPRDR